MTEDEMLDLARKVYASCVPEIDPGLLPSWNDGVATGDMDQTHGMRATLAAIRIMHERGEKLAGALEYIAETTSDDHDMRKAQEALTEWRSK